MNIEFAECDEQQSGQRFLDSSAPRLKRQVAFCEPAGGDDAPLVWDTYPSPAGKDQKLSREFEGGALISAAGAVPSLLDSLKNNRHKLPGELDRPVGRGKFCGRWSVRGIDPKNGRKVFRRVNCNSWGCSYCGPRKARTARASIRRVAQDLGLRYFLTLTMDPSKLDDLNFAVPYMRLVFNKFREYLKRKYRTAPSYICVLEFTKAGLPHLHVLFDRYLPQKWISNVWDSLGGGRICHIKQVTVLNVARYLSKYLTKELFLSAPKGTRRITTARSIKLFPKFESGIAWELVQESIYRLLESHRNGIFERQNDLFRFTAMSFDEEKFLKAFELIEDA
jgi:hypothetical protein